jgi:hypothetical protein
MKMASNKDMMTTNALSIEMKNQEHYRMVKAQAEILPMT